MRMTLYLYWQYDADILAMRKFYRKNFMQTIRNCLSAYLTEQPYRIEIPDTADAGYGNESMSLTFDDIEDADIISFLGKQDNGQVGNIIKNILRFYSTGFNDRTFRKVKQLSWKETKITLSAAHDADLIYLYQHDPSWFLKKMKESLHAYVARDPYTLQIPDTFTADTIISTTDISIQWGYEDDPVISYLKDMKDGLMESVIKNIFRNSFNRPVICPGLFLKSKKRYGGRKKTVKTPDTPSIYDSYTGSQPSFSAKPVIPAAERNVPEPVLQEPPASPMQKPLEKAISIPVPAANGDLKTLSSVNKFQHGQTYEQNEAISDDIYEDEEDDDDLLSGLMRG